jgi:type VI secretion system protein ImpJ
VDSKQIPEAIQWHEGMLLAPQHLQQLSQRSDGLFNYYLQAIAPFFWGVRDLEIDKNLLPTGVFRVTKVQAIMPDGLVVSHFAGPESNLQISLQNVQQLPVTIHLAVPARSPIATRGDLPRYQSIEGEPVVDESSGDGEIRIPRLKPLLKLIAGEVPAKYVSFPLARIQYEDAAFSVTEFTPPTSVVRIDSSIGKICSDTAAKIRERALLLSEQVRSPAAASRVPLVLETKTQIQNLVSGLPQFEAVLRTGVAHPYELYKAFCGLCGHLAGLGYGMVPPVFGPYNHNDLYASFSELQAFADAVIEEGIPQSYMAIPFQLVKKTFSLVFDSSWRERRLLIGMRGQAAMTEKDVVAWGEQCRIGSESVMRSMRDKRILGAVREWTPTYESLVPARGTVLFTLDYDPQFIKPDELLQVVNDSESAGMHPAEMKLYVKHPMAESARAR